MKPVGVELAAAAPSPPAARAPAGDDRFQRALDAHARPAAAIDPPAAAARDADPPAADAAEVDADEPDAERRPARAPRRLGERRPGAPTGEDAVPAPSADAALALRRWLTAASLAAPGEATPAGDVASSAAGSLPTPPGAAAPATPATDGDGAPAAGPTLLAVEFAPAPVDAEACPVDDGAAAMVDVVTAALARAPRPAASVAAHEPLPDGGGPTLAAAPAVAVPAAPSVHDPRPAMATTAIAEPREVPPALAAPAPTDRARLVLEHDGERVVVSVAVRHGAVSVAIDAAASSLGAAVGATLDRLDAALHSHGLHLADLTSGQPRGGAPGHPDAPPSPRHRADAVPEDDDRSPLAHDPRLRALA